MSLVRLRQLIPPPASPTFVPTASEWAQVALELDVALPEELLEFSNAYGLGTFRGTETTALSIWCPGHPNFISSVWDECQRYRDCRGPQRSRHHPFDVFPDTGGLLPLGGDENDVWLCWATEGNPANWPIVVRWTWGDEGMRAFNMPLSEFLTGIFERRIALPCWPEPTFLDDVQFVPYQPPE